MTQELDKITAFVLDQLAKQPIVFTPGPLYAAIMGADPRPLPWHKRKLYRLKCKWAAAVEAWKEG